MDSRHSNERQLLLTGRCAAETGGAQQGGTGWRVKGAYRGLSKSPVAGDGGGGKRRSAQHGSPEWQQAVAAPEGERSGAGTRLAHSRLCLTLGWDWQKSRAGAEWCTGRLEPAPQDLPHPMSGRCHLKKRDTQPGEDRKWRVQNLAVRHASPRRFPRAAEWRVGWLTAELWGPAAGDGPL